jgi:hypothetical protein
MMFSEILAKNLEKRCKREKLFIDDYKKTQGDEKQIFHLTSASKVSSKSNKSLGKFGFNHNLELSTVKNLKSNNIEDSKRNLSKENNKKSFLKTEHNVNANKDCKVYLNTDSTLNTDKFYLQSKETNAYSTKSKKNANSNGKNIKIHLNDLNLLQTNKLVNKKNTLKKEKLETVNYAVSGNTTFNLPNLKTFYNTKTNNNDLNNTLFPKINFPSKLENLTNYNWRTNTEHSEYFQRNKNKNRLPDFIKNNL